MSDPTCTLGWSGILAVCAALACAAAGCDAGRSTAAPSRDNLVIFVSIPPQAYLTKRIGAERVTVHTLLQPSDNPHTFNPTPKQVSMLGQADLYFRVGIGLETRLVERISRHPGLRVVNACSGIARRTMSEPLTHRGDGQKHTGMEDPHTWLDPLLAAKQAKNMCAAMKKADPTGAEAYDSNLAALRSELKELNREVRSILEGVQGRRMYVFHPAYGYFADRYGLEQVPIQAAGSSPGARHLSRLIREARDENVKAIFFQPQYSAGKAQAVAQGVGAKVVPLNPLSEDYATNLRRMARRVRRALQAEKAVPGSR